MKPKPLNKRNISFNEFKDLFAYGVAGSHIVIVGIADFLVNRLCTKECNLTNSIERIEDRVINFKVTSNT